MLTSEEFRDWCIKLDLNEQTIQEISQIRSSPPSRRVQSRRGNVSGRYPSQKMGMTIQFESHHHQRYGSVAIKQIEKTRLLVVLETSKTEFYTDNSKTYERHLF